MTQHALPDEDSDEYSPPEDVRGVLWPDYIVRITALKPLSVMRLRQDPVHPYLREVERIERRGADDEHSDRERMPHELTVFSDGRRRTNRPPNLVEHQA